MASIASRFARRSGDEGCCHDTILGDQNVVGPAGRGGGHDLETDPSLDQRPERPVLGESLMLARSNQDDFHPKACQGTNGFSHQFVTGNGVPVRDKTRGHYDQTC